MYITYESLIAKMESELQKAKHAKNHEERHGHLFAVKALAELSLDTREAIEKEQTQPVKVLSKQESVKRFTSVDEKEDQDLDSDMSIFDF
ncbi:DUF5327 family protein [Siminovitchia sediminis]|uniref:DUF5327 family protein n=1 Tax=Siminovitchia sediminis TaxID=1274353 RepID=A0ABW4KQY6_9BACI